MPLADSAIWDLHAACPTSALGLAVMTLARDPIWDRILTRYCSTAGATQTSAYSAFLSLGTVASCSVLD